MTTAEELRACISGFEALLMSATDAGDREDTANVLERLRERLTEQQASEGGGSIPTGKRVKTTKLPQDLKERPSKSTKDAEGQQTDRDGDAKDQQDGNSSRSTFWSLDAWSQCLLLALAADHGLQYYRHPRKLDAIVLVGPKHVLDDNLAREFHALKCGLERHLARTTKWVIAEQIGKFDDRTWLRWRRFR